MTESLDIDLYQASMLHAYFYCNKHEEHGAMELFARSLPKNRSFFVVAGIDRILEYLATLKFSEEDIKLLRSIESLKIDDNFCNYLASIDFSKSLKVFAMEEGEIAFANEPILRVEGPIGLCQYVEKKLLSIINHDVRIASKAARVAIAAKDRPVLEFGGRRAHDETAADIARAAYIAGCHGTSSVKAYAKYGIPCYGTMGHLWIMSYESEKEAFQCWNVLYPQSTYLVDTYNSRQGTENAIKYTARGKLGAIRLDSGNLREQSTAFKRLLINSDNVHTKIIASDDLNEYKISKLLQEDAKIDIFGVGTEIVSTPDAPTCGFVYKLVSVGSRNVCKIADGGKSTWPGKKQIWRHFTNYNGKKIFTHDFIDFNDVKYNGMCEPLLKEQDIIAMKDADISLRKKRIEAARERFQTNLQCLPEHLKLIKEYPGFTNFLTRKLLWFTLEMKR